MNLFKFIINLFKANNRGSVPMGETDAERLLRIELQVKTMTECPYQKMLKDLYEIYTRMEKHHKNEYEGYDKGR